MQVGKPKDFDVVLRSEREVSVGGKLYQASIGKAGIGHKRAEGDGITPIGVFPIRQVFFRPDRIKGLQSALPVVALTTLDGWCDDPAHPAYNTQVQLPFSASHEKLWREDNAYDIILVLGYNDSPVVAGKGSAIFMHLAQPDWRATEGCIAVSEQSMREILKQLTARSRVHIAGQL